MGAPHGDDPVAGALVTVGHGILASEELVALLRASGVEHVVDVRRFPGSRRSPHVARQAMADWLPAGGISYRWAEALGGRRSRRPRSPNIGLRNPGFQGYADHMATAAFGAALDRLLDEADQRPTAVLCAESVWWRCHRRLLADAVVLLRGRRVVHLQHDGRRSTHAPTPAARRDGHLVVYDRGEDRRLPGAGGDEAT